MIGVRTDKNMDRICGSCPNLNDDNKVNDYRKNIQRTVYTDFALRS